MAFMLVFFQEVIYMKKKFFLFMMLLLSGCNSNSVTSGITSSSSVNNFNSVSVEDNSSIPSSITTSNNNNSATYSSSETIKFSRKIRVYLNPSVQTWNKYVDNLGTEAEHMNNIAQYLYNELKQYNFLEVKANLSYKSLQESVLESNTFNSDIHFALHSNAGGGRGSEIFTISSYEFSNTIYNDFLSLGDFKRRGVKNGSTIYEIKNSKAKDKALMEILFHDNALEARFIVNNEERIARQFAESIVKHIYTSYGNKN